MSTIAATGGSTSGIGAPVDESKGRTFPCESCGAKLTFNIGAQSLTCDYCGAVKQLEIATDAPVTEQNLGATLNKMAALRAKGDSQVLGTSEVKCGSCGGTTTFNGPLTSSECPYCGSPLQRDKVHDAPQRIPVDGMLPFRVDRDSAARNLKGWVASRWFAPNEFRRRGVQGVFNGIYLPYFTYDAMTASRYSGERGEHYYVESGSGQNRKRERRTRWHSASGSFQRFFDDVLVCAASGLPRTLMIELEPWPLAQMIPFTPAAMSGYLAQTYETSLDKGFEDAKKRIEGALREDVRQRIGGDEQRIHSLYTNYGALTYKHLLLPVWLLAYRYGNKPYQVAINAATGEVQGERPWSAIKIALAVIAGLIVLAIVIALFSGGQQSSG